MSENFDINNELDAELNKFFEVIENLNFNPEDIDDQDTESEEVNKSLSELDDYMNQELLKVQLDFKKLHPDAIVPKNAYLFNLSR